MISERLLHRYYPADRLNGNRQFYVWIREFTNRRAMLLNLGAGPATNDPLRSFKGEVERVVGADVDPIVTRNHECDETHVIPDGGRLPLEDGRFDVVLSDFVLEHVRVPEA